MKKKKLSDMISLADDKYITEADPSLGNGTGRSRFKLSTVISCACCFLLILNLVIFVPFLTRNDDPVIPGADSTGGSLNHTQNPQPTPPSSDTQPLPPADDEPYVNETIIGVLDKYFDEMDNFVPEISDKNESLDGAPPALGGDSMKEEQDQMENLEDMKENLEDALDKGDVSTDINDNQVQGISEGDIIKRSDSHIFYLGRTELSIYTVDKSHSRLLYRLSLDNYIKDIFSFVNANLSESYEYKSSNYVNIAYNYGWEMYLSKDYKTLTVILVPRNAMVTAVFSFDVSNLPDVKMNGYELYAGRYSGSRMIDNELLLFTSYTIYRTYNKDKAQSYMPFYTEDGEIIIGKDICYPEKPLTSTYQVLSIIDSTTLKTKDSLSLLSYSSNMYVSKNSIYLTRRYLESGVTMTEITNIGYSENSLTLIGTGRVIGYIKNQYSLDEYNGTLRVASTVNAKYDDNNAIVNSSKSASLFILDAKTMQRLAMVQCFAPSGEIVRSARYEGDKAYICTSYEIVFSDPVYVFDLSNLDNITYRDTGTIDGYSSSLINFGKGYLLGIGYGSSSTVFKIEAYSYDETRNYISRLSAFSSKDLISLPTTEGERISWIKHYFGQDFDCEKYSDGDRQIIVDIISSCLGLDFEVTDNDRMKELYAELGGVVSVAKYELNRTVFSEEYKGYYIDRERSLVGLSVRVGGIDRYLLLRFNGHSFDTVILDEIDAITYAEARGFYEDSYYYIVTANNIMAIDVGNISKII